MRSFLLKAIKGKFSSTVVLKRLVLTSCMIMLCLPLFAQKADTSSRQNTDSAKMQRLNEVKINAGRMSARNTSATPVQTLKGAELEKLNSFSVADAIRFFSGVQLKDYGGIGGLKTINVRSLGSNHTAVFYDGIELGNAQNGQVDLGKFSLDNIEEISLYDGQKSTIFQPAKGFASASSLYLATKKPVFSARRSDTGRVSIKTGSFGLFNPSILWQHQLSDSVSSSVNAELVTANGRYRFHDQANDTSAIRQNGNIDAERLEAGFAGKLKDSSNWSARAYFYNSSRGLPGAILANHFDYPEHQWDRNIFVQASYLKNFSKKYSFLANIKYANDYMRFLDPQIIKISGFSDNRYYQQEFYLSAANQYHVNNWWDVALSTDFEWNKLNADSVDHFAFPERYTELIAIATEMHFNHIIIQANALATFIDDKVKYYDSAGSKTKLTPTLMFSWQPLDSPDLKLRAFYKDIFRMPTFNDLYYAPVGNVFLKPEYAKQYDLGFTYNKNLQGHKLTEFAIQVDGYFNQVTDKIVAVPSGDLAIWKMVNLGHVQIKGLELNTQATWQLADQLFFNTSLSYTYEQALDVTGNYNYRKQIPYVPLNSGSVLAAAEWRRWAFNYSFIYTGYRYDLDGDYVTPWYTHDIAFHYNTILGNHNIKITAEVNNLLNQYYEVIVNFPMPGRSYRFTLNYNF